MFYFPTNAGTPASILRVYGIPIQFVKVHPEFLHHDAILNRADPLPGGERERDRELSV